MFRCILVLVVALNFGEARRADCGCKCSQLTLTDTPGQVIGNCSSNSSRQGARWCYVDSRSAPCGDLRNSKRTTKPWSYEACRIKSSGVCEIRTPPTTRPPVSRPPVSRLAVLLEDLMKSRKGIKRLFCTNPGGDPCHLIGGETKAGHCCDEGRYDVCVPNSTQCGLANDGTLPPLAGKVVFCNNPGGDPCHLFSGGRKPGYCCPILPRLGVCFLIDTQCGLANDGTLPLLDPLPPPPNCRTKSRGDCIFPFTYKGNTHWKCTYNDSQKPWCAVVPELNVDRRGNIRDATEVDDCFLAPGSPCEVE